MATTDVYNNLIELIQGTQSAGHNQFESQSVFTTRALLEEWKKYATSTSDAEFQARWGTVQATVSERWQRFIQQWDVNLSNSFRFVNRQKVSIVDFWFLVTMRIIAYQREHLPKTKQLPEDVYQLYPQVWTKYHHDWDQVFQQGDDARLIVLRKVLIVVVKALSTATLKKLPLDYFSPECPVPTSNKADTKALGMSQKSERFVEEVIGALKPGTVQHMAVEALDNSMVEEFDDTSFVAENNRIDWFELCMKLRDMDNIEVFTVDQIKAAQLLDYWMQWVEHPNQINSLDWTESKEQPWWTHFRKSFDQQFRVAFQKDNGFTFVHFIFVATVRLLYVERANIEVPVDSVVHEERYSLLRTRYEQLWPVVVGTADETRKYRFSMLWLAVAKMVAQPDGPDWGYQYLRKPSWEPMTELRTTTYQDSSLCRSVMLLVMSVHPFLVTDMVEDENQPDPTEAQLLGFAGSNKRTAVPEPAEVSRATRVRIAVRPYGLLHAISVNQQQHTIQLLLNAFNADDNNSNHPFRHEWNTNDSDVPWVDQVYTPALKPVLEGTSFDAADFWMFVLVRTKLALDKSTALDASVYPNVVNRYNEQWGKFIEILKEKNSISLFERAALSMRKWDTTELYKLDTPTDLTAEQTEWLKLILPAAEPTAQLVAAPVPQVPATTVVVVPQPTGRRFEPPQDATLVPIVRKKTNLANGRRVPTYIQPAHARARPATPPPLPPHNFSYIWQRIAAVWDEPNIPRHVQELQHTYDDFQAAVNTGAAYTIDVPAEDALYQFCFEQQHLVVQSDVDSPAVYWTLLVACVTLSVITQEKTLVPQLELILNRKCFRRRLKLTEVLQVFVQNNFIFDETTKQQCLAKLNVVDPEPEPEPEAPVTFDWAGWLNYSYSNGKRVGRLAGSMTRGTYNVLSSVVPPLATGLLNTATYLASASLRATKDYLTAASKPNEPTVADSVVAATVVDSRSDLSDTLGLVLPTVHDTTNQTYLDLKKLYDRLTEDLRQSKEDPAEAYRQALESIRDSTSVLSVQPTLYDLMVSLQAELLQTRSTFTAADQQMLQQLEQQLQHASVHEAQLIQLVHEEHKMRDQINKIVAFRRRKPAGVSNRHFASTDDELLYQLQQASLN